MLRETISVSSTLHNALLIETFFPDLYLINYYNMNSLGFNPSLLIHKGKLNEIVSALQAQVYLVPETFPLKHNKPKFSIPTV